MSIRDMLWAFLAGDDVTQRPNSPRSRRLPGRRRHHRRHHNSRHMSRYSAVCSNKNTNFLAAVGSMITVVLLSIALAETDWFRLEGGGCKDENGTPVHRIGIPMFFKPGRFEESNDAVIYKYGSKQSHELHNCFGKEIVQVIKAFVSLTFLVIIFCAAAFVLDITGPSNEFLKIFQENAIFNIFAVFLCVIVEGFFYWASEMMFELQQSTRWKPGSKVAVSFGTSFYLITAAGIMCVAAASCNLLRCKHRRHSSHHVSDQEQLIDDDLNLLFPPDDEPMLTDVVALPNEPPPYTP